MLQTLVLGSGVLAVVVFVALVAALKQVDKSSTTENRYQSLMDAGWLSGAYCAAGLHTPREARLRTLES